MSCQALAQAAQAMGESPAMGGFKRLLEARQAVLAHLSWQHSKLDGSSCAVVAPCLGVGMGRKSSWVVLGTEVVGTQLGSAPRTRWLHQGPSGATWNGVLGFALHQGFSRVRSPVHSRNCTQVHIRQNLRRKVQGQKAGQETQWQIRALRRDCLLFCLALWLLLSGAGAGDSLS